MKKNLLFFAILLSFVFVGCSSDDDSGSPAGADSIVGSWEIYEVYTSFTFDGMGTFEETISTSTCSTTPVISINADGSLTATDFEVDYDFNDNEECFIYGENSGTWEDLGDGNFRFVLDGDTEDVSVRLGNNNNRIFISTEDDFFGGTIEFRGNRI